MASSSRSRQGTAKTPKSPKRKRNNQTAAVETESVDTDNLRSWERTQLSTQIEGTTKSPQRKRNDKAAAETESLDVDNDDYNIRSSEHTQLSTLVEGTTKSPKRKRRGRATAETESLDVDEDYNFHSSERIQLSTQIEGTTESPKGKRRGRATVETESFEVDEDHNLRSSEGIQLSTQIGGTTERPKGKRRGRAAVETESFEVDEDHNLRSSEGIQLSTQIEGTTESPKGKRRGRAVVETESFEVDNEDYNVRSPERTQLLIQIKEILKNAPVTPVFWAGCQLADMDCLQTLATYKRPHLLLYMKPLNFLPLQWNQQFRDSEVPRSDVASERPESSKKRKLNSGPQPSLPRSVKETNNCKKRDGYKCVLTKAGSPQAAHIFPHCLLQPSPAPDRGKMSSGIPEFWDQLSLFWDEDRIDKWKNTIFPNSQNPEIGVESCFNLISLAPSAHDMWNKGLFALKPLILSPDRKTLTVQFFWQVPGNYKFGSKVDLLTETPSSEGLHNVTKASTQYWLTRIENGSYPPICSGDTFTFTTNDPKNLPLPSLELLELQWVLQRLVGMCGAAEWPSLDEFDDDIVDDDDGCPVPDYADYSMHNSLKGIREWVEEAADMTPEMSTTTPGPSVIECH